jgi:hypothetical protein
MIDDITVEKDSIPPVERQVVLPWKSRIRFERAEEVAVVPCFSRRPYGLRMR